MKKKNKYIVILGPDGCGKTSIADGLHNMIQGNVISKKFSFNILPSISEILSGKKRENLTEGQKNSGMVEPVNFFKGTLLAFWYGIDHFLGTFYLKKNSDNVIIFQGHTMTFYIKDLLEKSQKLNKIFFTHWT